VNKTAAAMHHDWPELGEEEFRRIADSAPVPIWVTQLDRRRSFVNRAYAEFVGLDYHAALAFDWRQIIHPDDLDRLVAESVAGEASLSTFSLEGRYRRGDGQFRWLQSTSQPRFGPDGTHIGFIGVAHDVTEARVAEQEVREREAQFSAFINQATAGFAQVDVTGRFTLVNERFCAIVGRTADELYGLTMQEITHPADLGPNLPLFAQAVEHGRSFVYEKRYVRPDGSFVWVNNSVAAIRRPDGELYGVLAVTLDVTARRQAEAAHRRSEESMRLAIESAGMATWELDLSTMQGPWSANRFDLLGLPRPATLTGSFDEWLALVHPDDRARAEGAAHRCFATGAAFTIEYRLLRADTGECRWLQSHGSRIEGEDGSRRFAGVSFDITDRKRAEEEIRASERRLAFLDELGRATATSGDADAILAITTRLLGQHLHLSNCAYADMEEDEDTFNIRGDWHVPTSPSIVGRYSLATFGSLALAKLHAGEPLIINDNVAELGDDGAQAFVDIGIRATICMPFLKEGRLTALMAIHAAEPRRWTAAELALLTEVTQRSWAHIERVRSQAALRDSEARLRLAIEGARIGTWDWNIVERQGSWSARTAEIMGVAVDEPVTPELYETLAHPEDWPLLQAAIHRLRTENEDLAIEYRVVRPDGAIRWVSVRGVLADGAGARRLTGTIRDVTARREAQEALSAVNRTLEQEVANRTAELDRMWRLSRDLLLVVDRRWTMRAVNPAITALGYRADQVRGQRIDSFVHPDDRAAALRAIRAGARGPMGEFTARLRASDGSWRNYSWSAAPGDGEAYVIGRDITPETRRREELEATQEALRQAQKVESLGQLTGGVAHDFNNLLAPIIGSLDLLQRAPDRSEREQRLIGGALEAADRARTLVQRLLAFARRQPLKPGPVDVGALVESMAGLVASTVGPRIDVRQDIATALPHAIADANQLEMAVLNLSINARDAMPDGGSLSLAVRATDMTAAPGRELAPGRYVELSVRDSGTGMDAATLERAVEPFFSTKGIGHGTGLGLSMVHGLALQLGGALLLTSEPGEGTTVTLLLPVATEVGQAAEAVAEAPARSHRSARVLLVDDEPAVRASTRELLAELGYTVHEADSGEAALSLLRQLRPDILVTDQLMPGMTGVQLATAARAHQPELPVLLISGYAEMGQIPAALPRLAKPFRLDELSSHLAMLASGKRPA
jgi:PAS domain S-box-containing protein